MLRTLLIAAVAALALAVPALAASGEDKPRKGVRAGAVAACKAERAADPAAFKAKHANQRGRRAMRRCVRAEMKAARSACKAERAADKAAFRAKYGNERKRRAFRNCVREQAGKA